MGKLELPLDFDGGAERWQRMAAPFGVSERAAWQQQDFPFEILKVVGGTAFFFFFLQIITNLVTLLACSYSCFVFQAVKPLSDNEFRAVS